MLCSALRGAAPSFPQEGSGADLCKERDGVAPASTAVPSHVPALASLPAGTLGHRGWTPQSQGLGWSSPHARQLRVLSGD